LRFASVGTVPHVTYSLPEAAIELVPVMYAEAVARESR
jgi:hypothetical protein